MSSHLQVLMIGITFAILNFDGTTLVISDVLMKKWKKMKMCQF